MYRKCDTDVDPHYKPDELDSIESDYTENDEELLLLQPHSTGMSNPAKHQRVLDQISPFSLQPWVRLQLWYKFTIKHVSKNVYVTFTTIFHIEYFIFWIIK